MYLEDDHLIFHSAVAKNADNQYVTNGGRVLINVKLSSSLQEASQIATEYCNQLVFEGAQFRTDIAAKAFKK